MSHMRVTVLYVTVLYTVTVFYTSRDCLVHATWKWKGADLQALKELLVEYARLQQLLRQLSLCGENTH